MSEQTSYDGFSPAVYGTASSAAPPPSPAPPPPLLRPLSTGEILDRTFALYRRHFWLFIGIGTLPAAVMTLSAMVRLIYFAATHRPISVVPGASPDVTLAALSNMLTLQLYFLPATVLFILAYGLSHAAIVHAVANMAQGLAVDAKAAYRAVLPHWLRWAGIALRQFWTFLWPFLVPLALLGAAFAVPAVRNNTLAAGLALLFFGVLMSGGAVLSIINILRLSLAVPAGVQENLGVNAAVRRSRFLAAGRKGRILLALLMVYALQLVAGGIQIPLVLLATTTRGAEQIVLQAIELAVQFVVTALVTPIASIALCLFYIDERVRREGFDIELLMHRSFAVQPAAPAAADRAYSPPAGPAA